MCRKLPGYPGHIGYVGAGVVDGSILFCGNENCCSAYCYTYDQNRNSWEYYTSLVRTALYSGCTVINGTLLLTGGYTGSYVTSKTQIVSADSMLHYGPNLLEPRYHHCAVNLLDGRFLVIGGSFRDRGSDRGRGLLTTEFHDFGNGSAYYGPSLPSIRIDPACALFHSPLHNNRSVVLVIGKSYQPLFVLDFTQPLATWKTCEYSKLYSRFTGSLSA